MVVVSEAQVLKNIKLTLSLFVPEVIWIDRLQSGTVRAGSSWIHMCKPGTPDLYAVVKHGGGHVVFIECKSLKGKQSFDQKRFEFKLYGMKNIHYVLARSCDDVVAYIKKNIIEGGS